MHVITYPCPYLDALQVLTVSERGSILGKNNVPDCLSDIFLVKYNPSGRAPALTLADLIQRHKAGLGQILIDFTQVIHDSITGTGTILKLYYDCSCVNQAILRYNDVIMSAMASQIISMTIVYSNVYSRCRSKKTSQLRVTGLCEGNSPVTGEFPAQRASNAENVSIWWRHHVKAMCR